MEGREQAAVAATRGDVWLSNMDLAERYQVSIKTIRDWRLTGRGPQGVRFGQHVRYALSEVRRWEREKAREDRERRRSA